MSVARDDIQATFAATLVDEWVRVGVTEAVLCPGSRSTPLALALAARPEVRVHIRLDERSAGFFAIGLAAASQRPAVVCTTSGTAAAELHPAAVEAHHAGVPLVLCTADRPPELQGVGAPQTIDQSDLFGPVLRWRANPGPPESSWRFAWRSLGARLVAEACHGPAGPGPVHANLAFREPLAGAPGALPPGRPEGRPWHQVQRPWGGAQAAGEDLAALAGSRGVVVAGAGAGDPQQVVALARGLGWPVLADPRSGCRLAQPQVIAAADALLRAPGARRALVPEVVVSLGAPWASKVLAQFLAEAADRGAQLWTADPFWQWRDPGHQVDRVVCAQPGVLAASAAGALKGRGVRGDQRWLSAWQGAESAAQEAIDAQLATQGAGGPAEGASLNEILVARRLLGAVAPGTAVVASSSMPVRDLECYTPTLGSPPRVWVNRGANGIDGVTSTALGYAAAGRGPVVGLLGDLAFFHDVSALVQPSTQAAGGSPLTLVVLDNGGGAIFSFLPQAESLPQDTFEAIFATPMAPKILSVASGMGWEVLEATTLGQLEAALDPPQAGHPPVVVRAVVPPRAANVALHQAVHGAVVEAVHEAIEVP